MPMFFSQRLGTLAETAELTWSDIAEDYPQTGMLANVIIVPGARMARVCVWFEGLGVRLLF